MKKLTKKEDLINRVSNLKGAVKTVLPSAIIITHEDYGVPVVCVWLNRLTSFKPYYNYSFGTVEERTSFINKTIETENREEARIQERMREYNLRKEQIKEGSILVSSWGYEQTNIDFYKVISRKGDFVTLQEIESKTIDYSSHSMTGYKMPNEEVKIGEVFRKKIDKYAQVKLSSFKHASLWDGKAERFSDYA